MEQLEHQLLYVNMLKVKMLGEWSGNNAEAAKEMFEGTGLLSTEGEQYLGGAVGTSAFVCQYVESKNVG